MLIQNRLHVGNTKSLLSVRPKLNVIVILPYLPPTIASMVFLTSREKHLVLLDILLQLLLCASFCTCMAKCGNKMPNLAYRCKSDLRLTLKERIYPNDTREVNKLKVSLLAIGIRAKRII